MTKANNTTDRIIAEYEELVKMKEFYFEKKKEPFECTYQAILKALQKEYTANLGEKLNRWVNITNARYFKNSMPVAYYFQAKMLFRDGYYEATITLARSICEMICYDYLLRQTHPFGDYASMELENFRTLVKYLAVPKTITKSVFENDIISKLATKDDKNFLKSSYTYDKTSRNYRFKVTNGKEARNLNRFHDLFDSVTFTFKENFPEDTFQLINRVYDGGNTYVHARQSPNKAIDDAEACLNQLGKVLAYLYIVDGDLTGKEITTGYSFFPDVCQGISFGLDVYLTPGDAMRGYYNLPSQQQIDKIFLLKGEWHGEWKKAGISVQCKLNFFAR